MKKNTCNYKFYWGLAGICLTLYVFMYLIKQAQAQPQFYEGLSNNLDDDDNDKDEDDEKEDPNKLKVPQFQQGPMDGPVNSNTSSVGTNTTNVTTNTNAQNDCYATDSC